MNLKPNRDLRDLKVVFRTKLEPFFEEMEALGHPMAMHEGFRSQQLQNHYIKIGKSRVARSNHQDGLAADLHFTSHEDILKWNGFPPPGHELWYMAARVAKKYGIDNGGIIWKWDWNHFQDESATNQTLVTPLDWKDVALKYAVDNRISNGERPLDDITRVENMEMLRKYEKYLVGKYGLKS